MIVAAAGREHLQLRLQLAAGQLLRGLVALPETRPSSESSGYYG